MDGCISYADDEKGNDITERNPGPSRNEAKAVYAPLLHKLDFKNINLKVILPMLSRLLLT